MTNIVHVDFGDQGLDVAGLVKVLTPHFEQTAKSRGYNPSRAGEIAGLTAAAIDSMGRGYAFDLELHSKEAAQILAAKVAKHCAEVFLAACSELCYPARDGTF